MIACEVNNLTGCVKDFLLKNNEYTNIERSERIVSIAAGSFILLRGVTNVFSHPFLALCEVAIGAGLVYRGSTGYCPLKGVVENMDEEPVAFVETTVIKPL